MAYAKDNSILDTIKLDLGVHPDDSSFDVEIINDINTVFTVLYQLGVGTPWCYQITGPDETWEDFLGDDQRFNMVKSYVFRKTQMLFDPPTSGILTESINKQIDEMEYRLNVMAECDEPVGG